MGKQSIHHATVSKAKTAGFVIFQEGDLFRLQQIDDGATMQGDWERAADAAEAAAEHAAALAKGEDGTLEVEEQEEVQEEEGGEHDTAGEEARRKSGVMPIEYHKQYTANGGGCGDNLDQTLRDAFLTTTGMQVAEFRAFLVEHNLWRSNWEGVNPGMLRMNGANVIRGRMRNDSEFVITVPGHGTGRFGVAHKPRKAKVSKAKQKAADEQMKAAISEAA